jgi:hypothetical protein
MIKNKFKKITRIKCLNKNPISWLGGENSAV